MRPQGYEAAAPAAPSDRVRFAALVALWVVAGSVAALAVRTYFFSDFEDPGVDAHAYWLAGASDDPYGRSPESTDAFLYSPAFQQLMVPLSLLPFPAFFGLWAAAEAGAFAWLLRPLGWRWGLPCWLLCVPEIILGNVIGFLAVAVVLGISRRSEVLAVPLLTKITQGLLGGVWLLVRGAWGALLRYGLATLVLIGISYALDPGLWSDWVTFLRDQPGGGGVAVRFGLALVMTAFAAWTGRPWLLPVAMLLASPVIGGVNVVAWLAAMPRLVGSTDSSGQPPATVRETIASP